jgi:WhiB family redox-sensing transcriptional regulator
VRSCGTRDGRRHDCWCDDCRAQANQARRDHRAEERALSAPPQDPEPRILGPAWYADAACTGQTHLFFAPPGERHEARTAREAEAVAVCAVCPRVIECRDWARQHREFGIWGGETEEERARAGFASTWATGNVARVRAATNRKERSPGPVLADIPECDRDQPWPPTWQSALRRARGDAP